MLCYALPRHAASRCIASLREAAPSFVSQEAATEEALRKLHSELTQQVLEEAAEDMRNCGMDFSVKAAASGYVIEASGYDEHISAMLSEAQLSNTLVDYIGWSSDELINCINMCVSMSDFIKKVGHRTNMLFYQF